VARRILLAVTIATLALVACAWAYARVDEACLWPDGGEPIEIRAEDGAVAIGARRYVFSAYPSADYGAYIFPGGFLRGHPVAIGVDIHATDDAPLPELRAQCIRVRHGNETIDRRAISGTRIEVRTDLTTVAHLAAGTTPSLPDWPPGDLVHVWLRLKVADRAYLVDLGDTPISSVG